jgi:2-oxoglutarate ferredoxin oxidoreductase subunit gamma
VALNPPSLAKFEPLLVPGGVVVVNATLVEAAPRRSDIDVVAIPCSALARASGNERFVSVVALGGLIAARPIVSRDAIRAALAEIAGPDRPRLVEANVDAFDAGRRAAVDVLGQPAAR